MKVARSRLEPHRGPCHIAPPCSWLYAPWLKFFIDAGGIGEARCALAFLVTHLRKTFWSEFLNMLRQPGKDDYIYIYIYTPPFSMNATLSRLYSREVLPQYVRRSSFRACPHAASSCLRHCFGWPGTVLPDHVAGLKLSFSFSPTER